MINLKQKITKFTNHQILSSLALEDINPKTCEGRDKEFSICWLGGAENVEDLVIAMGIEFNSSKLNQIKECDFEAALIRINNELRKCYKRGK